MSKFQNFCLLFWNHNLKVNISMVHFVSQIILKSWTVSWSLTSKNLIFLQKNTNTKNALVFSDLRLRFQFLQIWQTHKPHFSEIFFFFFKSVSLLRVECLFNFWTDWQTAMRRWGLWENDASRFRHKTCPEIQNSIYSRGNQSTFRRTGIGIHL